MNYQVSLSFLLILGLFSQSLAVFGQTGEWSRVRSLTAGTVVRVETRTGDRVEGPVSAVTDDQIAVAASAGTRTIGIADVRKVKLVEKASTGKGIAIGAAVGAGAGAAIAFGALASTGGSDDTNGFVAPIIAAGAGVGALIGGVLRRKKTTTIYEVK